MREQGLLCGRQPKQGGEAYTYETDEADKCQMTLTYTENTHLLSLSPSSTYPDENSEAIVFLKANHLSESPFCLKS